jgi:hypothetical protein
MPRGPVGVGTFVTLRKGGDIEAALEDAGFVDDSEKLHIPLKLCANRRDRQIRPYLSFIDADHEGTDGLFWVRVDDERRRNGLAGLGVLPEAECMRLAKEIIKAAKRHGKWTNHPNPRPTVDRETTRKIGFRRSEAVTKRPRGATPADAR